MSKPLRFGILGAGFMGRTHARHLAAIDAAQVTAICSRTRNSAEALAGDLPGEPAIYDDFETMLDKGGIDGLVVALPPFAHEGQIEAAAAKGVHLFVEKPIALEVDHARKMAQAVQDAGVIAQVGCQMRFGSAIRRISRLLASGAAGKCTLFDAWYRCNSLHGPWWRDRSKSGGQVLEQVIHIYDLAMLFLGAPQQVTGFAANLAHQSVEGYSVEDTSAACVRFDSGAIASITGSNCAIPMQWNGGFTLICEKLTAEVTDPNQAVITYTDSDPVQTETIAGGPDPYAAQIAAFVRSIRAGKPAGASIRDGALAVEMTSAVLASNGQARPIAR